MDNNRNSSSSSMIWSRRSTLKLIELFKSKTQLWLPGHINYLNSSMRMQAYRDIQLELNKLKIIATIPEIRKKIHTLRSQYSQQVKNILDNQRRFGKVEKPSWWSFDEMSFLWPICATDTEMPNFKEADKNEIDINLDNLYDNHNEEQIVNQTDDEIVENDDISSCTASEPQQDSYKPSASNRKIQWTRHLTMKLIELYEKNKVLWNPKHFSQANLQNRRAASNEIAKEMSLLQPGISVFDIQVKLRMLRFQYRKQINMLEIKKKKGIEIFPKLWCFKFLSFLKSFHAEQDDKAIVDGDDDDHGDDDDDDHGDGNVDSDHGDVDIDSNNEHEESTDMDKSLTESMYSIEALEESDEEELKEKSTLELDDCDSDDLSLQNTDDLESESNIKSSEDSKQIVSSSKGRYNWIGTQVVDTLNELENEDVIFDTVVTIENLLQRIRELDNEQTTKSKKDINKKSQRLPQRRCNRMRPKLSDFNNFEVSFDLNQLHVKDVSVRVINQTIVIEGELENGCEQEPKQFKRYYDLPNGYNIDSVEAIQYGNGLFKVTASKLLRNSMDEIDLPIKTVDNSNLFCNITN